MRKKPPSSFKVFIKSVLITVFLLATVGVLAFAAYEIVRYGNPQTLTTWLDRFQETEASHEPAALIHETTPEEYTPIEPEPITYDPPEEIPHIPIPFPDPEPDEEPYIPNPIVTLTLTAVGDTTLGGDSRWAGYGAFMREFENSGRDHSHFMRNVAHIFDQSCITIANLEGTLTYATEHLDKPFVFRGPPHFAQILTAGNICTVTISNNHTIDFFERGMNDTRAALTEHGVTYFGNEFNTIKEVNGIYVGMFGLRIWHGGADNRNRIRAAITDLQNRGAQLIVAYYHWGVERNNHPEQYQINIGRYSIRNGVDLVLGAHPHVIQGIEEYMGSLIVYSLANFCFGGNANPPDQDSFIFQQTFSFYNGQLQPGVDKNIIPVFVSSVRGRNDFVPTVAEGADGERILGRIERYSERLR